MDERIVIIDCYLLFEHGSPKCARFIEAGHIEFGWDTFVIIMNWISTKLIIIKYGEFLLILIFFV